LQTESRQRIAASQLEGGRAPGEYAAARWRGRRALRDPHQAFLAFDIHLQDRGMVDEAVYSRQRHSLIREDATPLAEWLIGRYEQRSPLVACGNQLE